MLSCLYGLAKYPRFLIYESLLTFVLLLSAPTALAHEDLSPTDSVGDLEGKKYNFSLSMNAHGLFGFYDNLANQKGDPASPLDLHSAAGAYGELGFGFCSFGVSYYLDAVWSPRTTYNDDQGYSHEAGRERHGIRASYQVSIWTVHLIPEGGYVFLNEDAGIKDPEKKKPDRYYERYKDDGYNYGLSARVKLITIRKGGLWLYGRYVHDDLGTKADNYWIEIHAGGVNPEPPWLDKDRPYVKSAYFTLGGRWTQRTDGRSEWFLTLGFAVAVGLF